MQGSFQTEHKLYLILDFVNGGHLFFQLKRQGTFDERLCRLYAAEIVLALSHLHSMDIGEAVLALSHLRCMSAAPHGSFLREAHEGQSDHQAGRSWQSVLTVHPMS